MYFNCYPPSEYFAAKKKGLKEKIFCWLHDKGFKRGKYEYEI